ncbi:MAG: glutathione S-transferase family protein, partial [Acetobacteraceae bacterium]|nr:glutathione S-transferase family protein [Acetobacteraceae bacterium]
VWQFPPGADAGWAKAVAARLLAFMEQHLAERAFLAAAHPTIADLACYSYVAAAPEGDVALESYPSVCLWLRRVEGLPHFVPMPRAPVPEVAHA